MRKLLVTANSIEHLKALLKKKIDGVIISIADLSVNSSFYVKVSELNKIDFLDKEVFISLNKIMHNADLPHLEDVLKILKDKDIKILFYDLAVYNIAKKYNMIDKLVINLDHLNTSIKSNEFWYSMGIKYSLISSDITKEELLEIKKNSKMNILFLVYGYAPIFYSRRYLISNYFKYIGKEKKANNYHITDENNDNYIIDEEKYGTTIYTDKIINLINYQEELKDIDYFILNSNKINDSEFNKMVDNYLLNKHISDTYIGFFNTKTIYKVK